MHSECLVCGSDDLIVVSQQENADGTYHVDVQCLDCDCGWQETYVTAVELNRWWADETLS